MSIRSAIYTLLSGLEADVFPFVAEQKTTVPYAVYFINRENIRTQDGNELYEIRLRLEIYSNDLDDAVSLASTFESDLDIKDETVIDGENLMVSYLDSESDDWVESEEKYNITQEYTLKFE
jgi:hypothetical protein